MNKTGESGESRGHTARMIRAEIHSCSCISAGDLAEQSIRIERPAHSLPDLH